MCTVTIQKTATSILATMNRDEAISRAPEISPVVHHEAGLRWMAPHDSEKGGTWMGVNDRGVVACLLNAYQPGESLLPDRTSKNKSRGEIIPAILKQPTPEESIEWVEHRLKPDEYPSFTLLVYSPDHSMCYSWLKGDFIVGEPIDEEWLLRSSSGWDSEDVAHWREAIFHQWHETGSEMIDHLPRFHLYQEEGYEEWSPLMVRDWSATRSVAQAEIKFDSGTIDLRHWEHPKPDSKHADSHLTLPLVSLESTTGDIG
jgi:hypothetical protein